MAQDCGGAEASAPSAVPAEAEAGGKSSAEPEFTGETHSATPGCATPMHSLGHAHAPAAWASVWGLHNGTGSPVASHRGSLS